jgi:hypothetical protein
MGSRRWLCTLLLASFGSVCAADDAGLIGLGKRLYREGILPSGEPVVASVVGGLQTSGRQAACATCHRKSGLGAAEGQNIIRPLTVPGFFAGQENTRRYARPQFVKLRQPQYSDDSFDHALRTGIASDGRQLDPLMPRYQLDAGSIAALRAYLTSIAEQGVPGVTDTTIHFATVITPDAPPEVRDATLRVLTAFVATHNAGTRSERHRRQAGVESMHVDWRQWQLHVWNLSGAPETWAAQLEQQLGTQPVFAVLSGAGRNWQPVHDFCERQELPCLFPNVDVPGRPGAGDYSLYLSRGVLLEADVMARQLAERSLQGTVLQVRGEDPRAAAGADAFRQAWRGQGRGEIVDVVLRPGQSLATGSTKGAAVVLWLDGQTIAHIDARRMPVNAPVLASGTLLGEPLPTIPSSLAERLLVTWPFELPPQAGERRFDRARQWLTMRGIEDGDRRTLINTYFAASMTGDAITHLANNYSREYLIERIEHGANRSLATGVFPLVELGPGQRFASKGAYLVHLRDQAPIPASPWIVP